MKVWVLVTMPFSGGHKKLIRGFDTEAEARRIAAIVDECNPRYALDIEEIEVDVQSQQLRLLDGIQFPLEPVNPPPAWWQNPATCGVDLAGYSGITGVAFGTEPADANSGSSTVSGPAVPPRMSVEGLETVTVSGPVGATTVASDGTGCRVPKGPVTYDEPMPHLEGF